jgi:hypothetical protein
VRGLPNSSSSGTRSEIDATCPHCASPDQEG